MIKTISHSEKNKGWTSFWSFIPDGFLNINSIFLTIKDGQLWKHNDLNNVSMNQFYNNEDNQITSIKTVINDAMTEDKIFKTLVQEANEKWDVKLKTNLTEGKIKSAEFNTRESRQFSFIRGNEKTNSLKGNAAQGIGAITLVNALSVTYSIIPDLISVGDSLYQLNGTTEQLIGVISNIDRATNIISVASITTTPVVGYYSYAKKNSRAEGEEMRGYYLEVELSNTTTTNSELFAVSTNAVKSYV